MELTKKTTTVTSQEDTYEVSSLNFTISITARISNGNILNMIEGVAKRKTDISEMPSPTSTFNKYNEGQLNVQFQPNLTPDEQIELLETYNEIVTKLNPTTV